jgi:hypothetical protein
MSNLFRARSPRLLLPLVPLLLGGAGAGIYYNSQGEADSALMQFGRLKPQCEMWTNWQKLCSRTGAGGAVECRQDAGHRARPSRPFCVAGGQPPGEPLGMAVDDDAPTRQSRNRFCAHVGNGLLDPSEDPGPLPNCDSYRSDRPFNGTTLQAVAHPLCKRWARAGGGTPRLPALLYCAEWKQPAPCPDLVGGVRPPALVNGIIAFQPPVPTSVPVWGTYCQSRGEPKVPVDGAVRDSEPTAGRWLEGAALQAALVGKRMRAPEAPADPVHVVISTRHVETFPVIGIYILHADRVSLRGTYSVAGDSFCVSLAGSTEARCRRLFRDERGGFWVADVAGPFKGQPRRVVVEKLKN